MSPIDWSFFGRRRAPVIVAAESAECGLACLAMIAVYHGHDIDLVGLRQRFPLSLTGVSLAGLAALGQRLHMAARPLKVELASLPRVRTPAILHWDNNHFVVLCGVRGDRVLIHDPSSGRRILKRQEVGEHFTGYALEFWPAADFQRVVAKAPFGVRQLWSRSRGLGLGIAQVLGLSLALQLVALAGPLQIQLAVDQAITHGDLGLLGVIALAFALLAVFGVLLDFLRNWAVQVLGALFSFQVVGNVFRHLLKLPVSFFEKRNMGDLISRIQSATYIQDIFTRGIAAGLIDGVMAAATLMIMAFYSLPLTGVVALAVGINLALMGASYRASGEGMEGQLRAAANERSHMMESIRGIGPLRLMAREPEREAVWRNLFAASINRGLWLGRLRLMLSASQGGVTALATAAVVYLGGRLAEGGGFTVGMLAAFLAYKQVFSDRTQSLLTQLMELRFVGVHLERVADIVATEPIADDGADLAGEIRGRLELRSVGFRYGTTDPEVLKGVNLIIEPGDYVAFVGPSGGGKTTLLKILLGLHEPTSGEVLLDGKPATQSVWRAWRRAVGVVSQDDMLLSGNIAENIAFFDPAIDLGRVMRAARLACIEADILKFPMQYLTVIGEMGSALSGGQRQRLLLARALYREPAHLFLDEGTANLDPETEEMIADLVAGLSSTRVVVAHRPALVSRAARVLRVADGGVVEMGGFGVTSEAAE